MKRTEITINEFGYNCPYCNQYHTYGFEQEDNREEPFEDEMECASCNESFYIHKPQTHKVAELLSQIRKQLSNEKEEKEFILSFITEIVEGFEEEFDLDSEQYDTLLKYKQLVGGN